MRTAIKSLLRIVTPIESHSLVTVKSHHKIVKQEWHKQICFWNKCSTFPTWQSARKIGEGFPAFSRACWAFGKKGSLYYCFSLEYYMPEELVSLFLLRLNEEECLEMWKVVDILHVEMCLIGISIKIQEILTLLRCGWNFNQGEVNWLK